MLSQRYAQVDHVSRILELSFLELMSLQFWTNFHILEHLIDPTSYGQES